MQDCPDRRFTQGSTAEQSGLVDVEIAKMILGGISNAEPDAPVLHFEFVMDFCCLFSAGEGKESRQSAAGEPIDAPLRYSRRSIAATKAR